MDNKQFQLFESSLIDRDILEKFVEANIGYDMGKMYRIQSLRNENKIISLLEKLSDSKNNAKNRNSKKKPV